jgi:hypothetical protein
MAAAQFEDMEKCMRAAVRVLNERAEFCCQMTERMRSMEPEVSAKWRAASDQALEQAYKLRASMRIARITIGMPAARHLRSPMPRQRRSVQRG